ncbi:MAG TPA: hypothetical protein VFT55_15725, partial [Planctomycetota bacterium]|nr:hypothetical protein [Planctomycetota bacterium]
EKILAALCGNAPEVRAAALEAIPPTPTEDFAAALASQLQWIPAADAGEASEAMLRCAHNKEVERILYERLAEVGPGCDRALSALARSGKPLDYPKAVLAIASDASRAVTTRARALYCLERTGTTVPEAVFASLWPEHPVLDYYAARLQLRAAQPAGVQLLVRILDSPIEDEPPQRLVTQARVGARQLLAHFTDTSPYDDPHVWKQWASSNPVPVVQSLPDPRIDLDAEYAPQ